jgi:glyoxylate/hydroxypyruvate reductase
VTAGDVPKPAIEFLKKQNYTVDQWHLETVMPRDELIKRIKDADGVYCTLNDKINKEVISAASKKLKVIATMSVGVDHVDKPTLKQRGIRFGYTPNVLTDAVAELYFTLLLMTLRKTYEGADIVRKGQWPPGWRILWMCGKEIRGSTVGFVGFGRIGQAIASRLKPFMPAKMLYSDVNRMKAVEKPYDISYRSLDDLMKESDIVLVCCSLSEQTANIMNKRTMGLMKKGSYLINGSRGGVVDQDALVELLGKGHFGGVGLDVTVPEPLPGSHPLLKFPECVVLPHMGSSTLETRGAMADLTVKNIKAALEGKKMPAEFEL